MEERGEGERGRRREEREGRLVGSKRRDYQIDHIGKIIDTHK